MSIEDFVKEIVDSHVVGEDGIQLCIDFNGYFDTEDPEVDWAYKVYRYGEPSDRWEFKYSVSILEEDYEDRWSVNSVMNAINFHFYGWEES